MKTGLLIMVHGSLRAESNADVFRVAEDVRARGCHEPVVVCFLERNQPDIAAAVDECVAAGVEQIVAVPYFLHTGVHVASDLPENLMRAQNRHPNVEILMTDYVGRSRHVTTILAKRAKAVCH